MPRDFEARITRRGRRLLVQEELREILGAPIRAALGGEGEDGGRSGQQE